MNIVAWLLFTVAALLEVAGDAIVRSGLRGRGLMMIAIGILMLGAYSLLINSVRWDFSKMIGVYVAFFVMASILCGKFIFKEVIPLSTWLGLGIIIVGGLVIQFGDR